MTKWFTDSFDLKSYSETTLLKKICYSNKLHIFMTTLLLYLNNPANKGQQHSSAVSADGVCVCLMFTTTLDLESLPTKILRMNS